MKLHDLLVSKNTFCEPVLVLSCIPITNVTAVLKELTVTPSFQMANFWPPMLRKMSLKNGDCWRVLIVSVWRVYFWECFWPNGGKRQLLVTSALGIKKQECRTYHRPGRQQHLFLLLTRYRNWICYISSYFRDLCRYLCAILSCQLKCLHFWGCTVKSSEKDY